MDNICVLLSLFLILPIIEAKCSYSDGVYRFGENCGFMCHCKRDRDCDVITGECSSGCARGWYGPGCQYRDILQNKYSKFSNNSRSQLVTDGDSKTCLRQVKSSRTKYQSWSVLLDSNETINEIQIVTTTKSLAYFKNFEVFVEYIPSSGSDETLKQTCFRQEVDIPKSTTFTVLCHNPVIGNYVTIEFAELKNELELCDVKINGGRNLAFNRTVSQVSKTVNCGPMYCNAEASVDGQTKATSLWQCSYTAKEKNPWWKVDIGFQTKLLSVQITSAIDHRHKNLPYTVVITNDTNDASTYSTTELSTNTQTVALNVIGRFVTISINGKSKLAICEVSVFGDCPQNRCGYSCEKECHCEHATIWEKISGNCSIRCNKKGNNFQCNSPCDSGYFGHNCSKKCSDHCKHGNKYCNKVDGNCTYGCVDGWKAPLCDLGCDKGYYGQNCSKRCSDHCIYGNRFCNAINGTCTKGCRRGWKEPLCETCDAGFFGRDCKETCSVNCESGITNCDPTTGRCKKGCKPGWIEPQCTRACSSGRYGLNCAHSCSQRCDKQECNNTDGRCTLGCIPGWTGATYAKPCDAGFYGRNCEEKCSEHCAGGSRNCNTTTGYCEMGCQPGWTGLRCVNECPFRMFGAECKENCASNCQYGLCDHVSGDCHDVCKPGYQGYKCERVSDKILSDTNPCTGCHKTPKPNIVLICVGILCAIVVVYATVITILFKLKDGTNVSCSGRSNDESITNKTNKTETVTAEAATEATSELARVNINATDDESHQYTDLTPDTIDVEAAYETIQLE